MSNDLSQQNVQFPLAGGAEGEGLTGGGPVVIPFGLRYAVPAPASAVAEVDYSRISYDDARQIAVITGDDGSLLPAMKHTSTTTKTSTASQDRKGEDSDSDATGT
jgi:putative ATP-grasp target RiPP